MAIISCSAPRQGLSSLPAGPYTICAYIVFMARTFKYSSITNYLSALVYLHKMYGYNISPHDSFEVKCTLKGIRRMLGDSPSRKLPITLDILHCMYFILDISNINNVALWAAILCGFRAMLRKANIVYAKI